MREATARSGLLARCAPAGLDVREPELGQRLPQGLGVLAEAVAQALDQRGHGVDGDARLPQVGTGRLVDAREVEDRQLPQADHVVGDDVGDGGAGELLPYLAQLFPGLGLLLGGSCGPAPRSGRPPGPIAGSSSWGGGSPPGVQSPLTLVTCCLHNRTGKWDPTAAGSTCRRQWSSPPGRPPCGRTESGFVVPHGPPPYWVSTRNRGVGPSHCWRTSPRSAFFASPGLRGDHIATDDARINDRIRAREVLLIGADGEQLGVKPLPEALAIAREEDLDLVEVAPNANPPVCRIMNHGRYKYEQEQRRKESRRKTTHVVIKEMKFRPKIDEHDYTTKMKHVERFLGEGSKVKLTIMFRGREVFHPELGLRSCSAWRSR